MNRDVLAAISRMSQEPWAIAPQSVAAALASLAAMGDDQDYSLDLAAVYGVEAESGGKAFAFDRREFPVGVGPVRIANLQHQSGFVVIFRQVTGQLAFTYGRSSSRRRR